MLTVSPFSKISEGNGTNQWKSLVMQRGFTTNSISDNLISPTFSLKHEFINSEHIHLQVSLNGVKNCYITMILINM